MSSEYREDFAETADPQEISWLLNELEEVKQENGDLKFALQLIMSEGGTAGAIAYQALKELEQ